MQRAGLRVVSSVQGSTVAAKSKADTKRKRNATEDEDQSEMGYYLRREP